MERKDITRFESGVVNIEPYIDMIYDFCDINDVSMQDSLIVCEFVNWLMLKAEATNESFSLSKTCQVGTKEVFDFTKAFVDLHKLPGLKDDWVSKVIYPKD